MISLFLAASLSSTSNSFPFFFKILFALEFYIQSTIFAIYTKIKYVVSFTRLFVDAKLRPCTFKRNKTWWNENDRELDKRFERGQRRSSRDELDQDERFNFGRLYAVFYML